MTVVSSLNKILSFIKYVLSVKLFKKACRIQRYNIVASIEVFQHMYMKNYSKIFSFGEKGWSYFNHISLSKPNEPLLHNKITKALSKNII